MVPALPETLLGPVSSISTSGSKPWRGSARTTGPERPQTVSCGHEWEEGSNSPACCTINPGGAAN
jgi:hypothetical protein